MKRQLSSNPTMREVKMYFVIYLLGLSLVNCGRFTLMSFQTSFYVEDGLGAIGLTVLFSSTLVSAFVGPTLLKFFNLKMGLIFFDLSAVIYCSANFYPEFYTLIPGSILSGCGEAVFWICSGSFTVYFAKLYKSCGSKSLESYNNKCGGYLFSAVTGAQVIGNVITYVAFQTNTPSSSTNDAYTTVQTINFNKTLTPGTSSSRFPVSEVCGTKDCQDPRITEQNISRYVPPNPITLYIILTVFTALCLLGLLMHVLFAPSGILLNQMAEKENACKEMHSNTAFSAEHFSEEHSTKKVNCNTKRRAQQDGDKSKAETKKLQTIRRELILTLRHFIKPNQLLLSGLQFHIGFARSFLVSDMTRSYVSCIYGVSEVGICLAIFNATAFIVSMASGKVCERFGRKYPIMFAFVCNLAVYVFCLIWVPSESSSNWIIYGLYLVSGISNPLFSTTTVAAVASFYPESSSRGFTCWTVISTSSEMIQNAWSTSLCVNYKIYVLIAVLFFAVFTHIVAEHRHSRLLTDVNLAVEEECREEENKISRL